MGLDIVEFIMEVEESFGVSIPDNAAQELTTPGRVIDYLHAQLPQAASGPCISQRAFYMLRRAIAETADVPRSLIHSNTVVGTILPNEDGRRLWNSLHTRFDLPKRHWPRIGQYWSRSRQIREGVMAMVTYRAKSLFGDAWTRRQIADVVNNLVRTNLGVHEFTEDSRFGEDMGVA